MSLIAACGHYLTAYPWDWPGVWSRYDNGWLYSVLCFPCIMKAVEWGCTVQFTEPKEVGDVDER